MKQVASFVGFVAIVLTPALAAGSAAPAEPRGVEPVVSAEAMAGGITEITILPRAGATPAVYRMDLTPKIQPAREETPALRQWASYRLGAFVCFNTNPFSGSEHCRSTDPALYRPSALDVPGWIVAFRRAGMKYAVLTTRHTSGFLLWDSPTTHHDVASSGDTTDVVRVFVEECRRQGIAPGLYYCMWGTRPKPHANARAIILAQLHELCTRYGAIPCFWIDMMNWAPADLPTRDVYSAIKNLQPDSIVLMNQHVQDGTRLEYFPTDAVNGELWLPPTEGHNPRRQVEGTEYHLPFEYEPVSQRREGGIPYDPLGPSCWFTYGEGREYPPSRSFPAEALVRRIRLAYARGASNVLLSVGPDHTGRIRPSDAAELARLGDMLARAPGGSADTAGLLDDDLRTRLTACLADLCEWILTLDAGSGTLKHTEDTPWSIFINGNFARVLLAAHAILGDTRYLREALRWCDTFVSQQQPVTSSRGEQAGYWADRGAQGNVYLADAGTAATALALGHRHADAARKARYQAALERFARFVRYGCREDPQGQGRGGAPGWVIAGGRDAGALGCGYYRGHLSLAPYTIGSGIVGGAFFSALHGINGNPELAAISARATAWTLSKRQADGRLIYLIDGRPPREDRPLATLTYCAEGWIAAYRHATDRRTRNLIVAGVKPCLEWLLRTQRPDGLWGEPGFDRERSPGVVTLLAWYHHTIDPDPRIAEAIRRYCRCLLLPDESAAYGIKRLVRTSGFVGLAIADLLKPGVTFP